jgi:hypothetical protein
VKRREALLSVAVTAAGMAMGCSGEHADGAELSDAQVDLMLRHLAGYQLGPGEGAHVRQSFAGSRFTTAVDPTIQPQADFDPAVD